MSFIDMWVYVYNTLYIIWIGIFSIEVLYIFQLKEYRLDRIKNFFQSKKGTSFLYRPQIFLFLLFGFFLTFPFQSILLNTSILLIAYIIMGYFIYTRELYRPVNTLKSVLLFILFISTALALLYYTNLSYVLFHISLGLVFLLITQLIQIPTYGIKKYLIYKATKKLNKYKNLRVIGITGSYGKTSTRKFLVQLLCETYTVATTPKNINTEIGIAKFILHYDFADTDVFVVEMGAYKKGEIKLITKMVHPSIGIITTIGPEHIALFGSIEHIQEAKSELFAGLPTNGLAITNADNQYCRDSLTITKAKKKTFGNSQIQHPTLLISETKQTDTGISMNFNMNDTNVQISAPLYGMHHVQNIAAAYIVANELGVDNKAIQRITQKLQAPPNRLQKNNLKNNVVVINDTYNANPEGFDEALSILQMQSQIDKIVITRGMLELGTTSKKHHIDIGKKIGSIANRLIIISPDNAKELAAGAKQTNASIVIEYVYTMDSVTKLYYAILTKGNVAILLENRVPNSILKSL